MVTTWGKGQIGQDKETWKNDQRKMGLSLVEKRSEDDKVMWDYQQLSLFAYLLLSFYVLNFSWLVR